MRKYANSALSVLLLLGLMVALILVSSSWVIALVPVGTIAIVYLNIDPLIALLNGPPDNRAPVR
jgi:hypothetical protein